MGDAQAWLVGTALALLVVWMLCLYWRKKPVARGGPPRDIPGKVPMPDFMFEHPTDEEIRLARLPRGH
jgi:hypothetical protein